MTDLLRSWAGLNFAGLSRQIIRLLDGAGIDDANMETRLLLAAVFGQDVWQKVADPELFPDLQKLKQLEKLVQRRRQREPLSQILGEKGFWTLDLMVNHHVLTPRADSESLVELALSQTKDHVAGQVLDLGTGSGALLLAFLSERPGWQGTGVDISADAVKIAKHNAKKCQLSDRIEFIGCDWRELPTAKYDLVLSNPPYIASAELAGLDPEVVQFEPNIALDGGADGLGAYRVLSGLLSKWLRPGGRFVLEIGHKQAQAVSKLLAGIGSFSEIQTHQDLGGRDRIIAGCLNAHWKTQVCVHK